MNSLVYLITIRIPAVVWTSIHWTIISIVSDTVRNPPRANAQYRGKRVAMELALVRHLRQPRARW